MHTVNLSKNIQYKIMLLLCDHMKNKNYMSSTSPTLGKSNVKISKACEENKNTCLTFVRKKGADENKLIMWKNKMMWEK